MESYWSKETLASNLKFYRSEFGFSQKKLADETGLSYRLIQEIEAGAANPTLESLRRISAVFRIPVEYLISLTFLRLQEPEDVFLEKFKIAFTHTKAAVGLKDFVSSSVWCNQVLGKIFGLRNLDSESIDWFLNCSPEAKSLLKNQMAAERAGFVYPYTFPYQNPLTGEQFFLKCNPVLVLPNKGNSPRYSVVYVNEISSENKQSFYGYYESLMRIVYVSNNGSEGLETQL